MALPETMIDAPQSAAAAGASCTLTGCVLRVGGSSNYFDDVEFNIRVWEITTEIMQVLLTKE